MKCECFVGCFCHCFVEVALWCLSVFFYVLAIIRVSCHIILRCIVEYICWFLSFIFECFSERPKTTYTVMLCAVDLLLFNFVALNAWLFCGYTCYWSSDGVRLLGCFVGFICFCFIQWPASDRAFFDTIWYRVVNWH